MKTLSFALACLTSLATSGADAQVGYRPQAARPVCPAAWVCIGSPHHASTAAESYARGYADVVRAQGLLNLLTSQAMLNLAEARRLETENRVTQTAAYFRMREINRSHRQGGRRTRPALRSVSRGARVARGTTESVPGTPDLQQGQIAWPKALEDKAFESYRTVVEPIVKRQATMGTASGLDRSKATQALRAMSLRLRDRIREYSPEDYLAAKRFLTALRCRVCKAQASQ